MSVQVDWKSDSNSLLILVRIWNEVLGDKKQEWRGQIKDITSGEVRYFRDLQTLVTYFEQRLQSQSVGSDYDPNFGKGEAGGA